MMYEQQRDVMSSTEFGIKTTTTTRAMPISEEEPQLLDVLNLSGMSLDSLPNPSINLALICKLDLSNNNLQNIPESLTARLLNVAVLDVHSNQLKTLPNSIGCLSKLKILNVSGNLLQFLPRTIENCRSLEELNANFNMLTKMTDTLGFELINLKKLSVNSNKLAFLPSSTSHLTNLCILDARLNCLRCLPDDLENLINLKVLNVSQNFQYLRDLPYSIGLLISLVELDISYNNISTLPDSMGCLNKLHKLSVEGNPLVSPPVEVVEQGLFNVKLYLSEKMNGSHKNSPKKKSWVGKLRKYGTFTGGSSRVQLNNVTEQDDNLERQGFIINHDPSDYSNIRAIASPRYLKMFSPRRLFSPKTYFTR
ncbi:plant intracellular Ras-group-related LRR protein 6-like [Heracleum sosnowskyi]|uniref:Plant intracellular Ras-group-related LRR protein 6-like n=1 Tax=Heracleum sosnowskyi TaxID=360622 RepID=A0AAD8N2X8_9APIA|nr:plant intracellular Ras-group-related LRR protein 6-like [Heracleum sosnowskyi]